MKKKAVKTSRGGKEAMYRYGGKALMTVFATALVAASAFTAPVFAQDAWGADVDDFTVQRPARLVPEEEAGVGDPDFGAALEAAATAEGRTAAKEEFIPKNEIIITKTPVEADTAAQKKVKKTGSGEKLNNTMGGRLGIGSEIDLSLGLGIGLTDVNRLDLGINMGLGIVTVKGINGFSSFEAYVLYEWLFKISEELSWFAGLGGAFGLHDAWWEKMVPDDPKDPDHKSKAEFSINNPFGLSAGGRVGMEVDLGFIDPDHALSSLRSSLVGLDVRPMLYILKAEEFPVFVMTVGINYSYVFGGGKSKEKK